LVASNDDANFPVDKTSTVTFDASFGTTYAIRVDGVNPASGNFELHVFLANAPTAPTNVTGTPGDASVTLAWTAPSSTGGTPITNYEITPYIGAAAQTTIEVGPVTQTTISGLTNGTAYTFKVAAKNAVGTGPQSAESTAVTPKANQTIVVTSHAPAAATFGTSFSVAATGGASGNPVTFTSSGACTNSGNRFQMTSGTGTCQVRFDQAGDATYNPAPQVIETVVAQKADQLIEFDPLPDATFGESDFDVDAFATSDLPVVFTAAGDCTISSGTVHIVGAGTCTVTASQAGDANFNPAPPVAQTFRIAKADQEITFPDIETHVLGDPDFTVAAASDSDLPVSFSASGRCTVKGRRVHLTGAGKCTITATQPGNANFNPAPPVARTFAIARPVCSVPNVRGKRLAAAKRALAQNHCAVGRVRYVASSNAKKGRVVSQSRRPGRRLPSGTKVDLGVGRGRP
jgi:hypothetical protein